MAEYLVLDDSAIATGRTELDITPWVREGGVNYGDAQIAAYMAEGARGETPIDYRVPNRTVTVPLQVMDWGDTTFNELRTQLQAKVALFQREGGWVSRETSVGTVYADVVNATLKFGGGGLQAHGLVDPDVELTLECLPDWYGDEVTAATHSETTLPGLVWTETGIEGDYPGRCRLVVTEADGDDQLSLLWGFRSRHYSSASTAALTYQAEALTPVSPAAAASLSGASGAGSNTIQHASLGTTWAPVMTTNLFAGTYLTHTGTYRVWARVYSTSGSAVNLRLVWDVGDLVLPIENAAWEFPAASQFYMADLGEVRLDEVPVGTHRWQGQIQAKGDVGGESVRVDYLFFQPLDESAGRLRAPTLTTEGLTASAARDSFNQSAGALTGKTADVGGTWAGAGDTDDFSVEATGHTAQRTAISDTDINTGRYAVSGLAAVAAQTVQVDFKTSGRSSSSASYLGVLARYVDTSNWLMATMKVLQNGYQLVVRKRVAGAVTTLAAVNFPSFQLNTYYTVKLEADALGRWFAWAGVAGGSLGSPLASGQDSVLATGGTLDDGKPGFYDAQPSTIGATRNFDNFSAQTPASGGTAQDAVLWANQSLELRSDGAFREDSAGAAYGPVSEVIGDLPRVPVAGLEGRTTQVFVKASRGDLGQIPDAGIDDLTAQLFYRACWLYVPDDLGS